MRPAFVEKRIMASAAIGLLLAVLCFFAPGRTFAADGVSSLAERHVWFEYGYTECTGKVHPASTDEISYSESSGTTYPEYFSAYMMLCDTDHVLHVDGDGVTADKVTLTSQTPDVLEIDGDGNVTLRKIGVARLKATLAADETYAERSIYLDVRVDRHEGWDDSVRAHYVDRPAEWGLHLDTSEGPHQLVILLRPGASVKYSSENPAVASVDENGLVTPLSPGTTQILFDIDSGGGKYKAIRIGETIKVTGDPVTVGQDPEDPDQPANDLSPRHIWFTYGYTECDGTVHPCVPDGLGSYETPGQSYPTEYSVTMRLCDTAHVLHAAGNLSPGVDAVAFTSSDTSVLDIDGDGNVTLKKTGKAVITATVAADEIYAGAILHLEVTVTDEAHPGDDPGATTDPDPAVTPGGDGPGDPGNTDDPGTTDTPGNDDDEAARQAAEKAALRAEIAKAKSLKKPTLTVKALKGRKIKLTWSKVANADGYIVYIKYPGKSKYVKAVTKNATVKSVTHKGLSRNRVYYYKVRTYKKVNGKCYYGPFSKAKRAKAR